MGGKDDDSRSDLDKWLDSQRAEMDKVRQQFQDSIDKELRSWKDEASSSLKGPFERFKDFVDSNFGTVAQGVRNFPSNVSDLKAKMQEERAARQQEELEISRRWVGCDDSPDHIRLQIERQSADEREAVKDATYLLLRESYERNKHVPPEKILKLYKDNEWNFGSLDRFATPMLSMGGACYYKTETVENLPSTARWGWPSSKPQWLSVDWFKRSPYSPIRLESHPDMQRSSASAMDPNWRAAFEDLLCAALDKPMVSEEKIGQRMPFGNPQSTYHGPGLDWMLSLQCRGILPPQLPSLYKPVRLFDGFDEAKRPRAAEFMHDIDSITSNKSTRTYPLVKRDLNLLMDEIAIKSGPSTLSRSAIPQSPWRVPETEEDLYDDMPPYTDLVRPDPLPVPSMTGNRQMDRANTATLFWAALHDDDAATAAKCLDAYGDAHEDIDERIEETLSMCKDTGADVSQPPWYPVLMEAIRRHQSSTVKPSRTKVLDLDPTEEEEYDDLPPKSKINKGSFSEAEKSSNLPDHNDLSKKPGILSQLTTTQTTRMPDGTVTTTVVLKQRFADGREEMHESVHTTREEASQVKQAEKKEVSEEKSKRKGWFWN